MSKSKLESTFAWQLANLGYLPYSPENPDGYHREHRFHETRKWRLDFAFPNKKIACELEGGLFKAKSGHRSYYGVKRDMAKHNAALMAGWMVLRLTSEEVKSGAGVRMLERLLKDK